MTLKRIEIIANPNSGTINIGKLEKACEHINRFLPSKIIFTKTFEHAIEISKAASLNSEVIPVLCGGDGTIFTYINNASLNKFFAIVPGGTANVIAKELGIPFNTLMACKTVLTAAVKDVDVGVCNNKKFLFAAGVGFDAEVAANVSSPLKARVGQYAYHLSALKTLLTYSPPKLEIFADDNLKPYIGEFAIISNMRRYGGDLFLAPKARYDDSLIDILVLKKLTLKTLMKLLKYARGAGVFPVEYAYEFKCSKLKIVADSSVSFQLDGEVFEPQKTFQFAISPEKAKIITP